MGYFYIGNVEVDFMAYRVARFYLHVIVSYILDLSIDQIIETLLTE